MVNTIIRKVGLGAAAIALLAVAMVAGGAAPEHADTGRPASGGDGLLAGFVNPPASARPRVWWHWMNGNITRDGIRKDLEWMDRAGVAGVQLFDAALSTPQVVEKRLPYMSQDWKQALRLAVQLADQKGMEFGIAASPGWSETGGPWVPPQDGMKKLVWSITDIDGGKPYRGRLNAPPETTGPFQSMSPVAGGMSTANVLQGPPQSYYSDVAVLAYPLRTEMSDLPESMAVDGQAVDGAAVLDDSYDTGIEVPVGSEREPTSVTIEYARAQTMRSATLLVPGATSLIGPVIGATLEAEADGGWRKLAEIPMQVVPSTVSFPPVLARRFRLGLARKTPAMPPNFLSAEGSVITPESVLGPLKKTIKLTELRLSAEARVDAFEAKAGFALVDDYYALDGATGDNAAGVALATVIDLSSKLLPDGSLEWTPPAGAWRVLRMGYSLTGKTNHPATAEATGLEVDKFDGAAVQRYIDHYFSTYAEAIGADAFGARGIKAVLTDSIEVGASNWTPQLLTQFRRLRGYDPIPWLPALTGIIVGDRTSSDRFLYDYRRTLAELIASQHYGQIAVAARARGITYYGEAHERGRSSIGDDMAMREPADIPMAALWTSPQGTQTLASYIADMKGASSVAHVYGKPFAAAESLTTALHPWAHSPAQLKPFIDLEFAHGINRVVIHSSVHQPVDGKTPGMSLSIFGQYFNRHDTWAEMARPWTDYIARSSWMLQQGRDVADVAYFYGEEAPLTGLYDTAMAPGLPTQHSWDFINADALLTQLSVKNGELVSRGGARYRLLFLGGSSQRMTLPVLRKIAALVAAGATVAGPPPTATPSLADDPAEFSRLVKSLWGVTPARRILAIGDLQAALKQTRVTPDFADGAASGDAQVLFQHRRTADADIYFLTNRKDRPERLNARFRVAGKAPQLWRATTAAVEPLSYRRVGEVTEVDIELAPQDACFVVFRKPGAEAGEAVKPRQWKALQDIAGEWTVAFQPERGAPESIHMPALASLSESDTPGVKYFSGRSTYTTAFDIASLPQGQRVFIDLGSVGDVAEVKLNGREMGIVWTPPYRVDVTDALRAGRNQLEITVANLWVNRLVGDQQPGMKKVAFTTLPTYLPGAPLRPAGLLGPVSLQVLKE